MKKLSSILWGLVLAAVGVLFALNALGVISVDIFFDGWWTLFIIVPCAIGLFTERQKTGNIIGLTVGVFLLLACQDIMGFDMLWKLLIPAIIVIIGIKLILNGFFGNKADKILSEAEKSGKDIKPDCAIFSGCSKKYDGEIFEGADITAVFGGAKYDLSGAIIEKDCAIKACAVFGGIDIIVPKNINVKVSSTSVFGGVTNKTKAENEAVTLYVDCVCLFGGVDIK